MNPTPLSPTDGRHVLLQSAAEVLHAVEVEGEHAVELIAGAGDRRDLPMLARKIVYRHWERLDALETLGAMWLVDEELEGLTSAILEIGIDATAVLIADELAELGVPLDAIALADESQIECEAQAA